MYKQNEIDGLRDYLDKYIDTTDLTDTQVAQIVRRESLNGHSPLNILNKRGAS